MSFAVALLISRVAICAAWNFPGEKYEGSAQSPYIMVTCVFHNTGPFPTVRMEAQCDVGEPFADTEKYIGLKRDPTDSGAFIVAATPSPHFKYLINNLNSICPKRNFTNSDFSKFIVTSDVDELMIRLDGRYVSIRKVPS
ncbi:hypothetical protein FOL47_003153 [Perkinsus chesapeaki]|uniref:Uncharacterized protein n=1 Tax=Perkinsus chesapeaki TaxID=330153 RepID=A0A7J6M9U0_PERCH|nr:hypothetical protein FOL47_003153 [Perkinsus chesapeaki]